MQLDLPGATSGTAGRIRQCIRIIYRFFKKDVKIKPERFSTDRFEQEIRHKDLNWVKFKLKTRTDHTMTPLGHNQEHEN